MIDLDITQEKKLSFKIAVSGVSPRDLKATLRIKHEGIEYGFPCTIVDNDIIATIAILKDIITAKTDEVLTGTLDVIAGDTFLQPYSTNFHVIAPVKVEAQLTLIENIEPLVIESKKERKPTKLSVRLMS